MSDPHPDPQKKIIIDEDWKSRVEAERETLQQPKAEGPAGAAEPEVVENEPPLPPPTLEFLATTLAMQASLCLGLAPDPLTGKVEVRLSRARHFIGTLELLAAKTAGNRSDDETAIFEQLLHSLRLDYVAVADWVRDRAK